MWDLLGRKGLAPERDMADPRELHGRGDIQGGRCIRRGCLLSRKISINKWKQMMLLPSTKAPSTPAKSGPLRTRSANLSDQLAGSCGRSQLLCSLLGLCTSRFLHSSSFPGRECRLLGLGQALRPQSPWQRCTYGKNSSLHHLGPRPALRPAQR